MQYITTVRLLQDTLGKSPNLFVLSGAHPVKKLSSQIQRVGLKYGLNLPSATKVRKIGATSVALKLGESAEAHLVTRQMSHSVSTDAQYYQAIVGDKHAAAAYSTMSNLRKERSSSGVPNSSLSSANRSAEESSDTCSSVQRRRGYTPKETRAIESYFGRQIMEGKSVSLTECNEFLSSHPMTRSPKNIQDKVRSVIKAALS